MSRAQSGSGSVAASLGLKFMIVSPSCTYGGGADGEAAPLSRCWLLNTFVREKLPKDRLQPGDVIPRALEGLPSDWQPGRQEALSLCNPILSASERLPKKTVLPAATDVAGASSVAANAAKAQGMARLWI